MVSLDYPEQEESSQSCCMYIQIPDVVSSAPLRINTRQLHPVQRTQLIQMNAGKVRGLLWIKICFFYVPKLKL